MQAATIVQMLLQQILNRGADKEVLLLESQFLALRGCVIRIQNTRQVLGINLVSDSRGIVAGVEVFNLERNDGATRPQAQMIDSGAVVARDEHVIAHCPHILSIYPVMTDGALRVTVGLTAATKPDSVSHPATAAFPEVLVLEPGASEFALRTILANLLFKNSVVITRGCVSERSK